MPRIYSIGYRLAHAGTRGCFGLPDGGVDCFLRRPWQPKAPGLAAIDAELKQEPLKPVATITPRALAAQIESGDAPIVLDVRSRAEFDQGRVPGAIHLPFWKAGGQGVHIPAATGDPIVVYCGHGPRAWIAGAALRRRGFTRVIYLAGHMAAWREAMLPEEQ